MLSGKLCSCCFHSFLHSLYLFSVFWVPGPLVRYGNTCVNKTDRNPWLCNVRKQFSDSAVSYIDINNPQTIIDSFTLWKMTLTMYITCNLRLSVLTWWSSPAAAQVTPEVVMRAELKSGLTDWLEIYLRSSLIPRSSLPEPSPPWREWNVNIPELEDRGHSYQKVPYWKLGN